MYNEVPIGMEKKCVHVAIACVCSMRFAAKRCLYISCMGVRGVSGRAYIWWGPGNVWVRASVLIWLPALT